MTANNPSTKFNFFCAGGVEQLSICKAEDLAAVEALDPKLWLAISMPTVEWLAPTVTELLDHE